MAEDKRKILIDVMVNATESIKNTTKLVDATTDLIEVRKTLDRTTETGKEQYEDYSARIRVLNKDLRDQRKFTDNLIRVQESEDGSLNQLKAQLSNMTAAYNSMGKAKRQSAEGKELEASILETTKALSEAEQAVGNYRRSVGNYENALKGVIAGNNRLVSGMLEIATTGDGVQGSFRAIGVQGKALGKTFLALAMNPIVLTLAAIVAICALLYKAFKRNEENGDKLNVVFSKLGGIFQWLLSVLEPVATFLVDVLIVAFDRLSEAIEWTLEKIASVMEFLGLDTAAKWVRDTTNGIKEMTEAATKLAKAEAELRKEQRESEKIQKEYQKRAEKLRQLRDDESKTITERIKANEELGAVLKEQLQKELAIAEKALEVANLRVQIEGRTTENLDAQAEALTAIADIQERITGQESEQLKNAISLRKEAADKAIEAYTRTLEARKSLNESLLRAEANYQSEDFKKRQEYERKIFDLSDTTEREKLAVLRKFGKITQKEYDTQIAILNAGQKEFNNSQIKGLNDYFKGQLSEISSMVEQSVDTQIADTKEKFKKAQQELNDILEPVKLAGQSDEDFEKEYGKYKQMMLDRAVLSAELTKQEAKEIEAIKEASLQKQIADIEKYVDKQYQEDFDRFIDNEREKNQVQIKALEEIIQKKKDAGITTLADEAEMRALQSQANQIQLNTELLQNNENAKARYESKRAFLEKEKELYKDNADKQIELNAKLAENDKQYMQERIESFSSYRDAALQMMSGLNDFITSLSDAEVQRYEEENERKKESLQARLDQGLISQEEYDQQVAEADAELDKKKKEAEQKQAIRERMMKVFTITTDTAMGIAKAVSMSPLTFGMPWSAFVGATGALQLASVLAAPLPKAAKGGLIGGKLHSQGGTIIEAERGESIINRRSTQMFAPLLSMINQMGGGVPFAKPMSDGGFSFRTNSQESLTAKDVEKSMSNALKELKVVTYLEDYDKARGKYDEVNNTFDRLQQDIK